MCINIHCSPFVYTFYEITTLNISFVICIDFKVSVLLHWKCEHTCFDPIYFFYSQGILISLDTYHVKLKYYLYTYFPLWSFISPNRFIYIDAKTTRAAPFGVSNESIRHHRPIPSEKLCKKVFFKPLRVFFLPLFDHLNSLYLSS